MKRKIIQIQATHGGTDKFPRSELYALADDGTLWMRQEWNGAWRQVSSLPNNFVGDGKGEVRRGE